MSYLSGLSFLKPDVKLGDIKAEDMELDKVYTLIGDDGIYRAKRNGVMKTITKVEDISSTIKGNGKVIKEGFELLVPKIPFKYYMMCLNFFRDIHTKYGTEAGLVFYYRSEKTDMEVLKPYIEEGSLILDGDLIVYCPIQRNSGGLHEIKGETLYEYLRVNSHPYVEVHSHHVIGCNWSGTDDANMCHYQFFTVFRHIYRFEDTLTRYRFNNTFYNIKTSDIFEIPFEYNKDGMDLRKILGLSEIKTSHAQYYDENWLDRSLTSHKYSRNFVDYIYSLGDTFDINNIEEELKNKPNVVKDYPNYAMHGEGDYEESMDILSLDEDGYNYGYGMYDDSEDIVKSDEEDDSDIVSDDFEDVNKYIMEQMSKKDLDDSVESNPSTYDKDEVDNLFNNTVNNEDNFDTSIGSVIKAKGLDLSHVLTPQEDKVEDDNKVSDEYLNKSDETVSDSVSEDTFVAKDIEDNGKKIRVVETTSDVKGLSSIINSIFKNRK